MIASIYILFPGEYPELRESALQQFQWTIERFGAMQNRNPLARSALGVLRAILVKFTKAIGNGAGEGLPGTSSGTPASTRGTTTDSTTPNSSTNRGGVYDPSLGSSLTTGTSGTTGTGTGTGTTDDVSFSGPPAPGPMGDWTMAPVDALASIAPMYPTSDLIFNDLSVVDDGTLPLMGDVPCMTGDMTGDEWHFEGGFGSNTVWQFLNQG